MDGATGPVDRQGDLCWRKPGNESGLAGTDIIVKRSLGHLSHAIEDLVDLIPF